MNAVQKKEESVIQAVRVVAECIKESGGIPAGHLYAQLMGHGCSLEMFTLIIGVLCEAGKIKQDNHMLTWIG